MGNLHFRCSGRRLTREVAYLLVSFILEHYTRECELENFYKIKKKCSGRRLTREVAYLLVSFILEHYTRECELENFYKIKKKIDH